MNFNISSIAFYPMRDAQMWRNSYNQRNIAVVTGENLPPFIINDAPATAPDKVEIYNPDTNTRIAELSGITDIISHTSTVNGVSVNSWIYQGTSNGIWGFTTPGYYYLKVGDYYSDIIKFGPVVGDYVKLNWQYYDDIITSDGTLISKYVKYQQIFETVMWHPTYEIAEEGRENNGIFYAMSQTTKKTCGFTEIVNEPQLDTLNLARMADIIEIEARTNGVIRTFTTNTFTITDTWQSDDVASIDVQFDLFNIIRKYQLSNEAPEPLPIPTPPAPPSNYYIRGTAPGANSVQFEINGVDTTIPVYNGQWEYGYDTPLETFRTAVGDIWPYRQMANVDKITSIDLSESCMFAHADGVRLCRLTNCTSINFAECTFAVQRSLNYSFAGNPKLTTISMPEATFAGMTQGQGLFYENSLLESVSMPKALLTKGAFAMFGLCEKLKSVNIPLATFASETTCAKMFTGCKSLETITMPLATFENVTTMRYMFENARGFYDDDAEEYEFDFAALFPACTAAPTDIQGMFEKSTFQTIDIASLDLSACANASGLFADSAMREADMTAAQFTAMLDVSRMFKNCYLRTSTLTLLESPTFANVTNAESMFEGAKQIGTGVSLNLTAATFASAATVNSMFKNADFATISMAAATFASVTDAQSMFYGAKAGTIDLPSATFGNVTGATNMFLSCSNLTTLNVPNSATWEMNISFAQSENLTIASLTAISKWCADMTAYTPARTLTVNANAKSRWQLPATIVQYNTAVALLGTKNWTIQ